LIKRILVVGGGSAGWMTASYLSVMNSDVEVTLVESSDIPIIGVGESTVPSFVDFIKTVGLTEQDLFDQVGSIRKYTLEHNNWNGYGHQWYHHFIFNKEEEQEQ
jgi:tryptophan halogenase